MKKQFKDVEEEFNQLKKEFRQKKITRREFIERLKELRLKDSQGRFWMIGAQSGNWYYYDGKNWIPSEPPSVEEGKAICIYCGFENKLEAEYCARCGESLLEKQAYCPRCGRKLEDPGGDCPYCSKEKESIQAIKEEAPEADRKAYFVFRSLSPLSSFLFLGVSGIFIGILVGAFTGTTGLFYNIVKLAPAFLGELQGTIIGGILYAIIGGILGFVIFGAFGFFLALFINFISSFVGGLKVHLD